VTALDGSVLAPANLPADARAALLLPAGNTVA